ncbi:MAG: hypothetical protein J7M18_00505, partial [Candidatus Eremiobacteraeota bacterium]|nr:hypothetical protein [Candidatus Eremiobacteraeota bacterium]
KKKAHAKPVDTVEIKKVKGRKPDTIEATGVIGESPKDIVVMREGGVKILCDAIDKAQKNIDIKMYIITTGQKDIINALKRALKRGVNVRLMVEDDPFYWEDGGTNPSQKAIDELVKAGAKYKPDNPKFSKNKITHEKTITIDNKKSIILTGNIGASTFNKNLDLGAIIVKNPDVVKQISQVFNADWDRTPLPPLDDVGLVVSPENAREKITEVIRGAKKSIHIVQQSITDKQMLAVINDQMKKGVKTELLLTNPAIAQMNMQPAAYLATHGAKVRYLKTPYIHAKAISIDQDDSNKAADVSFIGSQNFSFSGLQRNREIGYIFNDRTNEVEKIFDRYSPEGYDIPSKQVTTDGYVVGSSIGSAIRLAEDSIILQTNLLSDQATIGGLCKAVERGVDVKVMIPRNPFPWDPNCDLNIKTARYLKSRGVDVKFTDSTYKSVQGTAMVVDKKEAIVSTENVSYSAFKKNIGYGVINIDPKEVREVHNFLKSDWEGLAKGKPAPVISSELVVSPKNARNRILGLIKDADKSINLETYELTDKEVLNALSEKAKSGVNVQVVVYDNGHMPAWQKELLDNLEADGARIQYLSGRTLKSNYLNVDNKKAYVGGHSFASEALDESRSFGFIITHPEMLKITEKAFGEHMFLASVDHARECIHLSKKFIKFPEDRMMLDHILDRAKYGVRVEMEISNPSYAFFDAEVERLNRKLEEVANMDPVKDKELIAEFYGLKYKPDEALKYHARLVDAMKSLEKGKKIVQLVQKSEDQITDEKLLVDNDPVSFPSRFPDLETDSLKKPGENENSPLGPSMSWNIKQ